MNYSETCDYLFRQVPSFEKSGRTGFNEGLAVTLALDEHYGHPHRQFKTIHVAGTNGKGSVSHTLAAQLQAQGLHVGLYTSPHLVDFRERIRVNGEMIPESYVVGFVADFLQWNTVPNAGVNHLSNLNSQAPDLKPSFFELTTALAFKYFADRQVDVAVIEVGLGGRLDCTNIITPLLSIITNISFDHTDMLGNTLAQIATEKAGIIKPHVPVVIGEATGETRPVFEMAAAERQSPICFAEDEPLVAKAEPTTGGLHYTLSDGTTFAGDLGGLYQARNTNTALHALQQLVAMGIIGHIDYSAFANVGRTTGLMGRWQKMGEHPVVVCDTGHNSGGWQHLSHQLLSVPCRQLRIVFGMVSDKDVYAVMAMLPRQAVYYFTKADNHRAMSELKLKQTGDGLGLTGRCFATVADAFQTAVSEASADDFIFVGGSTYLVADWMKSAI